MTTWGRAWSITSSITSPPAYTSTGHSVVFVTQVAALRHKRSSHIAVFEPNQE